MTIIQTLILFFFFLFFFNFVFTEQWYARSTRSFQLRTSRGVETSRERRSCKGRDYLLPVVACRACYDPSDDRIAGGLPLGLCVGFADGMLLASARRLHSVRALRQSPARRNDSGTHQANYRRLLHCRQDCHGYWV